MNNRARIAGGLIAALLWTGAAMVARANFVPKATLPPGNVPSGINYQGRLSNDGVLVSGKRDLRFRLYTEQTGGILLWKSPAIPTTFKDGIFGAVMDIPKEALMGVGTPWLEFEVENIILLPREPIRAVP